MNNKNIISFFRFIALAEGISFLFLLFIAMPLKYFNNMPQAVRFGGMIHGLLFVAFVMTAWNLISRLDKSYKWFFFLFTFIDITLRNILFRQTAAKRMTPITLVKYNNQNQ